MPELFGKQVKPETMWIGGGAIVIFGVAYYRYSKTQKADAAAAAAATAPGTGAGSSDQIDPATGFPSGSTEDAAALTSQAGYNTPTNLGYSYGGPNNYPVLNPQSFTSNAQWSQAAEQYITGQGADSNTVGNALGKYITGQTISDANQENYVNQAIAFEGYPPVPGPDGFPPNIRTAPVGDGHKPPQEVVVPRVAGLSASEAYRILRSEALNPSPGGVKSTRIVLSTNPPAGKSVPKHTTVRVTVK